MSTKKQKRRSISVRGDIYEQVYNFCKSQNISMSSFVEERIVKFLENPSEADAEKAPAQEPVLPAPVAMPDKPAPMANSPVTPPAPKPSHIKSVSHLTDQQLIDEMKQHFTF